MEVEHKPQDVAGSYSKDPDAELDAALKKNYINVRFQQGKPILDRELNLLGGLSSPSRLARWYIGDGVPDGDDGFRISDLKIADNDFTIKKGRILVNGFEVVLDEDTTYQKQPLISEGLQFKFSDIGIYDVHLHVDTREISSLQDHDLQNEKDIGFETALREKVVWKVLVTKTGTLTDQHMRDLFLLAKVDTSDATPVDKRITDLRANISTLASISSATSKTPEDLTLNTLKVKKRVDVGTATPTPPPDTSQTLTAARNAANAARATVGAMTNLFDALNKPEVLQPLQSIGFSLDQLKQNAQTAKTAAQTAQNAVDAATNGDAPQVLTAARTAAEQANIAAGMAQGAAESMLTTARGIRQHGDSNPQLMQSAAIIEAQANPTVQSADDAKKAATDAITSANALEAAFNDSRTKATASDKAALAVSGDSYVLGDLTVVGRVSADNLSVARNNETRGALFLAPKGDFNHALYNNDSNADGEGAWDGAKWNTGSGLRIRTGAGNAKLTALSINDTGNVGIGTPPTAARLSVLTSPGVYDGTLMDFVVGEQYKLSLRSKSPARDTVAYHFDIVNNGPGNRSDDFLVFDRGNVGIGVPEPKATLHVAGGKGDLVATEGDFKIGDDSVRMKVGVDMIAKEVRLRADGGAKLILGSGQHDVLTINDELVAMVGPPLVFVPETPMPSLDGAIKAADDSVQAAESMLKAADGLIQAATATFSKPPSKEMANYQTQADELFQSTKQHVADAAASAQRAHEKSNNPREALPEVVATATAVQQAVAVSSQIAGLSLPVKPTPAVSSATENLAMRNNDASKAADAALSQANEMIRMISDGDQARAKIMAKAAEAKPTEIRSPYLSVASNVGIGIAKPGAMLHVKGGQGDLNATEGDLKIGDNNHRLKIGVDLNTGDVRMRAQSASNKLILGCNDTDVLLVHQLTTTIPPPPAGNAVASAREAAQAAQELVGAAQQLNQMAVGSPQAPATADSLRTIMEAAQAAQRAADAAAAAQAEPSKAQPQVAEAAAQATRAATEARKMRQIQVTLPPMPVGFLDTRMLMTRAASFSQNLMARYAALDQATAKTEKEAGEAKTEADLLAKALADFKAQGGTQPDKNVEIRSTRITVAGDAHVQGKLGIGTDSPGFPLSFPNTFGDKVAFWGQSGNNYGIGVQSNLLQLYTDSNTAGISLGWGRSGDFHMTANIQGSGRVGTLPGHMFWRTWTDDASDPSVYFHAWADGITSNFSRFRFRVKGSTVDVGNGSVASIEKDGVHSNIINVSDVRLKKSITPLENSAAKLLSLRGVSFKWKDESEDDSSHLGLIAQEVEKFFPEVVSTDSEGIKGISATGLLAPLIEAFKQQHRELEEMRAEIRQLKNRRV
jgi:hypothetical protein